MYIEPISTVIPNQLFIATEIIIVIAKFSNNFIIPGNIPSKIEAGTLVLINSSVKSSHSFCFSF